MRASIRDYSDIKRIVINNIRTIFHVIYRCHWDQKAIAMLKYKSAELSACGRWLEVELCIPHETYGWTLIGGGRRRAELVYWHSVSGADLPSEVDARQLFEDRRKQRAGNAD